MEFIPCPPENADVCWVLETTGRCFTDIHHLYWPNRDYNTKVEKEFRELEVNKVRECRDLHNTEHELEEPPIKPSRDFMLSAIQRAYAETRRQRKTA